MSRIKGNGLTAGNSQLAKTLKTYAIYFIAHSITLARVNAGLSLLILLLVLQACLMIAMGVL
jgi:hypothetical protein